MDALERKKLAIELSDYVFNRFKKEGKLKRILEYNHTVEESDVYNSIAVSVLEFLETLDHNLLPSNGKNKKTIFYSAYKHSLKVFTEYIHDGCEQIYRIVKTNDGYKVVPDREFQVVKRKYSYIDSVSKRNTCSIDGLNHDEDDRRDFFEKNYTRLQNIAHNTLPLYTAQYSDKSTEDQSRGGLKKVLSILEKMKTTTGKQE